MEIDDIKHLRPWRGDPFYNLGEKELEDFGVWFFDNCIKFTQHVDYNVCKEFIEPITPNACYGNGKFRAITQSLQYAEGLVYINSDYGLIPHGFNVIGNTIADFTFYNLTTTNQKKMPELPSEYFGIIIPQEFILQNRGNLKTDLAAYKENVPDNGMSDEQRIIYLLHNPLLVKYWRECTQQNKKEKNKQ